VGGELTLTGTDEDGKPNDARERLYGGGQPFELTYQPGPKDWKRWLVADAERIVRAEEERVNDPPADD
jgi:hypothetical protein